jgi:lambda repressor-like predicted transcriptional regulator
MKQARLCVSPEEDLPPETIRHLLNRKGLTYAALDRAGNLAEGSCRKASFYPMFAGEMAIAEALRLSPRQIWPSRYGDNGQRLQPQPSHNYKTEPRLVASQKRSA